MDFLKNHPLAPYTTLKIGGPADYFINPKTPEEFIKVLSEAINFSERSTPEGTPSTEKIELRSGLPITILGNGSNVLISDSGIRGFVIKNSSQSIEILDKNHSPNLKPPTPSISTHRTENEPDKYLDFTKIDYDESDCPTSLVKLSSGTPLPYTINYLINQGLTGLQWFAYIPGTIGGAVYFNIHGGTHHFSEYVDSIEVFDLSTSHLLLLTSSQLSWDYDQSYFQSHPELVITSVTLKLYQGDSSRAKLTALAWIQQKTKVQPMNSAGSVFKNPSLKDCLALWGEQKSSGWIIDHELNWKGKSLGGAQISPIHANFIVNTGSATATDYYTLAKSIQAEVLKRFNLKLDMEVKLLGEFH
jgi:UDP-N-acetylmuramate dehydrogenase